MGKAPAVVIIVRHGARLDAADKQWHLTSPTPYDPPLTYGGWTQSRALGARIASLLRSRETDDDLPDAREGRQGGDKRRRRHRVVIHTSPFLRCVQTSIAISSGLAQAPGKGESTRISPGRASSVPFVRGPGAMHSSPKIRPHDSPRLAAVSETRPSLGVRTDSDPFTAKKATLKVDAFLGEWLSPDYFEHITPPPGSTMMVASAKGDLLRREDTNKLISVRDMAPAAASPLGFPGGWGSPIVAPKLDRSEIDDGPLSLSSLSQALPAAPVRRDRTSNLSSAGSNGSRSEKHVKFTRQENSAGPYTAPAPSYAISLSDPIPPGYVAHARDHCTNVDFQWDSSRSPQNWGDGGEYGEEWSSMHKRFRRGLQELVGWYANDHDTATISSKVDENAVDGVETEDEDETDLVVVLVSHGAGCNALIGALTNQPVLLDVGMASLTMALRKPTPVSSPLASPTRSPTLRSQKSSRSMSVSDDYDVKLLANTEHLRLNTNASHGIHRSSSAASSTFKERFLPGGGRKEGSGITVGDSTSSMSTVFGSIRRTASIASGPRNLEPARKPSIGLWSAPTPPGDNVEEESDMFPNFGENDEVAPDESAKGIDDKLKLAQANIDILKRQESLEEKEDDAVAPLGGLWGSPRPPGEAERIRDVHAPKRRWTINQPGMV